MVKRKKNKNKEGDLEGNFYISCVVIFVLMNLFNYLDN